MKSVSSDNDALVALSNKGVELAGATNMYMVELFPWCKSDPGFLLRAITRSYTTDLSSKVRPRVVPWCWVQETRERRVWDREDRLECTLHASEEEICTQRNSNLRDASADWSDQLEGLDNLCAVSQLIQDNIRVDGNIQDEDVIAASVGMLYIGELGIMISIPSY